MSEKIIYNARILPMTGGEIRRGYLCWQADRITRLGAGHPEGFEDFAPEDTLNAHGGLLLPGFIDAHTHLGIIEDSLDFEGDDCNESTDPFTPHLRALDGFNPLDRCFAEARAAGVTTVLTSPGSANPCGGTAAIIKTAGTVADEMLIGTAMKFALGENPKVTYNSRAVTPITRMGIAAIIREGLFQAKRYWKDMKQAKQEGTDKPDFDMRAQALKPVLRRRIKAHFHCHRADDIVTAVRIIKEFHLDGVIVHATDAAAIAPFLAKSGVPCIAGPILCDRCKPEMQALSIETPAQLHAAGIPLALCTDHTVIPIQYLPLTAALAVRGGLDYMAALHAITAGAADLLGFGDSLGRLAAGYAADFQLYPPDTDPLTVTAKPAQVWVGGRAVL